MSAVNLIKMAPGLRRAEELEAWFSRFKDNEHHITTKNFPKREQEILTSGGSLYWVFGNQILARNVIKKFRKTENDRCAIMLDSNLIMVQPTPKRAFQGWRYFEGEGVPQDMRLKKDDEADLPEDLVLAMNVLGVI